MKKIFSMIAILMMAATGANASIVSYIDGNGTSQTADATELASGTTSWTDGSWYIVPEGGLTVGSRITVNGTVNLILRDGATLTASAGITTTGATLNIYAQSAGTGALTAKGSNGNLRTYTGGSAGIGGIGGSGSDWGSTSSPAGSGGTVNIYGGIVTATGGNGENYSDLGAGAGIGGGGGSEKVDANGGAGGTVNIYGGTVTATGGNAGSDGRGGAGTGIGGGGNGPMGNTGASGTLTLGTGVKLYNGTNNTGTVLDDNDSASRSYSGSRPQNMFAEGTAAPAPTTYAVTLADGTEDATNWEITPNTDLEGGETVTIKYKGTKKVKSVKAVKK